VGTVGQKSNRSYIISLHREEIFHDTQYLEKLQMKSRLLSPLVFMLRCQDHHVIPLCVKIKRHVSMEAWRRTFQHTGFTLICKRIHYKRQELDKVSPELFHLCLQLAGLLTHHDWDMVANFTAEQAYLTLLSTAATQKQKLVTFCIHNNQQRV
jgi:hypothetical protein